jgi:hypothetical protein
MSFWSGLGRFFTGTPEKFEQRSSLDPQQMNLQQQLVGAGMGQGAGGAFGQSADYYRNLMSDNPQDMQSFAAPEMRQFREDIIPGLSEQFAGMGAGGSGLSSSGFRNAAVSAGTDLAERLGSLRAQLRQVGAQGLQGIGAAGLSPYLQNMYRPQQPGFLQQLAPLTGQALGAFGGPALGMMGANWADKMFGPKTPASPQGAAPSKPPPNMRGTTNDPARGPIGSEYMEGP